MRNLNMNACEGLGPSFYRFNLPMRNLNKEINERYVQDLLVLICQ